MKRISFCLLLIGAAVIGAAVVQAAEPAPPWAALASFTGEVKVAVIGADQWSGVKADMVLADNQIIQTGAKSQAVVRFSEGDMSIAVGENTKISLQDLLLKARLEKMRGKITPAAEGTEPTKMQVTPLTGVRGTDAAEGKAEDPKREHHWQENEPK